MKKIKQIQETDKLETFSNLIEGIQRLTQGIYQPYQGDPEEYFGETISNQVSSWHRESKLAVDSPLLKRGRKFSRLIKVQLHFFFFP